MVIFGPQNFGFSMCTGFQIGQLNVIVNKASFNRKFTLYMYGKHGFKILNKSYHRCRRFLGMPTILHLLPVTDIVPAMKL